MNTDPDTTPTPPPSIKEQSIHLLAEYATLKAKQNAISAPFLAQIAIIQQAVAAETAPIQEAMDKIKDQAEALGLANAAEIFGEHRSSVTASGHTLKLSESEAVSFNDEGLTINRLLREAGKAHLIIEPEDAGKTEGDRMAAAACLRISVEVNKAYVQSMYPGFRDWFNERGIFLEPTISVKLAEAPKPRVTKPKRAKGTKQPAEPEQPEQEAA